MRLLIVLLCLLCGAAAPAAAQLSLSFGMPGLSIGINVPVYPQLERVPGYPVYYAPGLQTNFFFYDGLYWVYQGDDWYASDWYDGPWSQVPPSAVPLFILRIPVRYYRNPPTYFSGWRGDAPPRWGEHWGNDWQKQRSGWDRWDRKAVPAPAPLPRRPAAAPEPDRTPPRAQPTPPPRREPGRPEQGRPDQGKKDQGKGRDNSEERDGERKK